MFFYREKRFLKRKEKMVRLKLSWTTLTPTMTSPMTSSMTSKLVSTLSFQLSRPNFFLGRSSIIFLSHWKRSKMSCFAATLTITYKGPVTPKEGMEHRWGDFEEPIEDRSHLRLFYSKRRVWACDGNRNVKRIFKSKLRLSFFYFKMWFFKVPFAWPWFSLFWTRPVFSWTRDQKFIPAILDLWC